MEELVDKLDSGQKKATVHLVIHYSTVNSGNAEIPDRLTLARLHPVLLGLP
jgi:hypothetical protein